MYFQRLQIHQDLRDDLAKVKTLEGLANVSKQLRLRCQVRNCWKAGKLSDMSYLGDEVKKAKVYRCP